MTDFTKAELEAAVATALENAGEKHAEDVAGLKTKVNELIAANKQLKRGADVRPEDLQEAESRADKAEAALADAQKQLKAATTDRDKAAKALELEQSAARNYAINAEINGAIAEGNVAAPLVPAFRAFIAQQAKADLVDGNIAVLIGDKPARDHIKAFLSSEDGKHYVAAPASGGGGAPGGASGGHSKVLAASEWTTMPPKERAQFMASGGQVVEAAAA